MAIASWALTPREIRALPNLGVVGRSDLIQFGVLVVLLVGVRFVLAGDKSGVISPFLSSLGEHLGMRGGGEGREYLTDGDGLGIEFGCETTRNLIGIVEMDASELIRELVGHGGNRE